MMEVGQNARNYQIMRYMGKSNKEIEKLVNQQIVANIGKDNARPESAA